MGGILGDLPSLIDDENEQQAKAIAERTGCSIEVARMRWRECVRDVQRHFISDNDTRH